MIELNELISRVFVLVPSLLQMTVIAPPALVYAGLAGWAVGILRTHHEIETPYTRKIFHFVIIVPTALLHLSVEPASVAVYGSAVSLVVLAAVFRGASTPLYEALARPSDRPHRTLFVVVPLLATAVGGLTSLLLYPRWAPVGYWVCGVGDAVGEPVGSRWGRHQYRVPSLAGVRVTRTLEGSAAVLTTSVLAAVVICVGLGVGVERSLLLGSLAGLSGACVEAVTSHGLDNFTIQVVVTVLLGLATGG